MPVSELVSTKGIELATKGVQGIIKNVSKIDDILRGSCKVQNREITIMCPELKQRLSIAFEVHSGHVGKIVKFPFGKPTYVKISPVEPDDGFSGATKVYENGFEIDTGALIGSNLFILDVEYKLEDDKFIDAFIQRDRAKEFPKGKEREFWIHAEIKHPKVLKTRYGRLELRDIDFGVDVGVSEQIKMVIPPAFRAELETGARLLSERDPRKIRVLSQAHAKAVRTRGSKDSTPEVLGHLQGLFFPNSFQKYVDVLDDFHYSDCLRGCNYYELLPFPTYPKTMTVISRTDLNLEKLAASGIVRFREHEFIDRVKTILNA